MTEEVEEVGSRSSEQCRLIITVEVDGMCEPECLDRLWAILKQNVKKYEEELGVSVRLVGGTYLLTLLFDLVSQGALT